MTMGQNSKTRVTYFGTAILMGMALGMASTAEAKNPIPSKEGDVEQSFRVDRYFLRYGKIRSDKTLKKVYDTKGFKKLVEDLDLRLFGGPVVGDVTPQSARIWVRTTKPAKVQVIAGRTENTVGEMKSRIFESKLEDDLSCVVQIGGLRPAYQHYYNVIVDGKPVFEKDLPSFRTYPKPGQKVKFSVAFGGGARVNPSREDIWKTIASRNPVAFLFMGDNLYIDEPKIPHQQRIRYYRRQLRPEYQELSSGCAIYAIWDDHDFADNDSWGGPDPFKPEWKPVNWKIFKENWVNPYYGGGEEHPGCWFDFSIGEVDFFMTDGRYYRDPKGGTMLGPVQKEWLLKKLAASDATFKVIASGTPWSFKAGSGSDAWAGFKKEREEIFSFIDREKIGGVILISADRHRTDVYKIKRPEGYDLYEFSSSKLTNWHSHDPRGGILFSYNKGNFFGLMGFDFTASDPTVTFKCITRENEEKYEMTLKRSQLEE